MFVWFKFLCFNVLGEHHRVGVPTGTPALVTELTHTHTHTHTHTQSPIIYRIDFVNLFYLLV